MHEYRVVENDGKIAVINDKAYTEVYRKTIGGKDCRMAITVDKKESSWGTDYTVQNTNKWYGNEREVLRAPMGKDGKWKTKKAKFFFKTNADTHVLTIGRSRKGRDESINSIYFFYGQESTPYFRRKIIDEKANIVSNNSGLHVADGNTDRFGWGVHKIKTFDSGWYGEALCQYALFNRHIYTVHDGIYGSRKADGKVGAAAAGSAALAALHPLDFDPDTKWNVAASYGTYGHYQAYALGAYYRPSESSMVSVGGTIGSGADAMNVGLSFKVGKGNLNHISTSRVAMAKEIQDLRAEVEALRQAVISLHEGHDVSPLASALFLDTPENHAAYQAVQALAAKGVLPAYEQGNKVKTRYEIATMLYAAVQQGKAIDGTLLRTFAPELERVHVAVISRKENGEAAITRVRVGKL